MGNDEKEAQDHVLGVYNNNILRIYMYILECNRYTAGIRSML